MLRSYHANDLYVDSGVSNIKGKETKILMLENGVYLPIDLPQSIEISYNPRAIFQLHVWEDSMYQISEGFSDKEVYEFNAKRYRTILKYCIILMKKLIQI